MVLPESMGNLSSTANGTLIQNRTHRKSYGNHSISHTSTIDRLGDRQAFQPSHNNPKSRSISVSSPTEMFLPEYPSFKSSQNLVANEVIPSTKFHSRSLSSSIPQSRGSLASSSLLSNSNPLSYTHSSSTDLKSNIIFENSAPSHSSSYEIVPAMSALSISTNPPSFLQAETTVDEFPILVRRESTDFTSSAPANTLDLPQAPDLSPLAFSDHHSAFAQAPSSSHNSLSNSLNGSTQSLSSIFMANQLHTHAQPHPSLSEPSLQHMAMHDSQVLTSAPQQPPTLSSYTYTQSNKQARSKPLKQTTPAPFPSFEPAQHASVDNSKRFPQPNGGISPNQQFPQTPAFKQGPVPQYRATSFGQHVPPTMENKQALPARPSNANRSVSAYQPRHFNAPRKQHEVEAANRFSEAELDKFEGDIYSICKDQHGCRYLQKVLDGQDEREIEMIFTEIKDHITELMTDLFGNYLCQKLLERVNSDQRTVLVRNASPDLTKIALNQHGTRALQKMIEFSVAKEQVAIIVESLGSDVVRLIQDLNGNHVIQKCLNHLASEDSQFIIDAVSENCVTVGTHRHGCCVLQRCIDHSSDAQKRQLITQIIENSFMLVQDPFGNYVIQYVLELGILEYSESLIHRFIGHACQLSMQKFSSNVIEKCLRIALPETKTVLIEELVGSSYLDTLLRDSYANYVIQTTLEFADDATKEKILQSIIPILPAIRNTPYGRKIVAKLASTHDSSHVLLAQLQAPQFPPQAPPQQQQQHLQYPLNSHQHHLQQPQQHQHQHQQHSLQHQHQQHQYQRQHQHQQHQHQHHQRQAYTQNRTIPLNPYYHGFSVPPVTNPAAQTVSVHDAAKQ